jgi:hypothetical protein
MASALPWLVVLAADLAMLVYQTVYAALSDRATLPSINPLYPTWGGSPWLAASTLCSVAVLLTLHAAVAARAARGAGLADRLWAAAVPALAAGPLVGLLAAIAKAAPAAVSLAALDYQGDQLRHNATSAMPAGAFWGALAGAIAAGALLGVGLIARGLSARAAPIESADKDEEENEEGEKLAELGRLARRAVTIGLAGLTAAVLLAAALGNPGWTRFGPVELQPILGAIQWRIVPPFPGGTYAVASYLPLATVPAYLLALLVALPVAGLAMGPATTLIQRASRAWLAVAAAVLFQATVAGLLLGVVGVGWRAQQLGGSWAGGYATVLRSWFERLPNAAGYIALVAWIPALAMAGAAWALDRRQGALPARAATASSPPSAASERG